MKLFVHYRAEIEETWVNFEEEWEYIPRVGEYIQPKPNGILHRVYAVVYTPPGSTYPVELFTCHALDLSKVIAARIPLAFPGD